MIDVRRDAAALPPDTAVCMGAFDGLHRGHQALLQRARTHAPHVALVTFDPHPTKIIAPDRQPKLIYAPAQRERVAAALDVSALVLLPFDEAMSKMSPEAFVQTCLIDGLRPRAMVVGADFRFGARRAGDAQALRALLAPADIAVDIVPPVPLGTGDDAKLSSTDIRRALDAGDVQAAGTLLGRWHALAGTIVHGAKRGRALGFPTANLGPSEGYAPPIGIYATALAVWDPASPDYGTVWPAVTNVGHNPTFTDGDAPVVVETYVLDQALGERLYGVDVEVSFVARLRGEIKFDGADALVDQMHRDAQQARDVLTPEVLARVLAPPTETR
ncbi:MAG: bifunctional riboflavin kinase/FAD synthetase [Myxococcota bacterium]